MTGRLPTQSANSKLLYQGKFLAVSSSAVHMGSLIFPVKTIASVQHSTLKKLARLKLLGVGVMLISAILLFVFAGVLRQGVNNDQAKAIYALVFLFCLTEISGLILLLKGIFGPLTFVLTITSNSGQFHSVEFTDERRFRAASSAIQQAIASGGAAATLNVDKMLIQQHYHASKSDWPEIVE